MARVWIEKELNRLKKRKGELAVALNIPPSRISDIIRGDRRVQSQEIVKLSQFLNMDIKTVLNLLEDDGHRAPNTSSEKTEKIQVVGDLKNSENCFAVWPVEKQYTIILPKQASYTSAPKFALEELTTPPSRLTLHICVPAASSAVSSAPILQKIDLKPDYKHGHDQNTLEDLPSTATVIAAYQQH